VKIGLTTPLCGVREYGDYPESANGMRLTQFVHLSSLLRGDTGGADFLVVHLHSWPPHQAAVPQWPDMAPCLPDFVRHFGAPVYADDDLRVFALSAAARVFMSGAQPQYQSSSEMPRPK
jgi:hypothetical protein